MRSREFKSHRLDNTICGIITVAVILLCLLLLCSFVITRTHMFHQEFTRRLRERDNSQWLIEQCNTPEFYRNMKQHSAICEEVQMVNTDSIWLHAMRDVIDKTSICGSFSCEQLLQEIVLWVATNSVYMAVCCVACALVTSLFLIPLQRRVWSHYQVQKADSELALRNEFMCSPYDNIGLQTYNRRSDLRARNPNLVLIQ